jgi:hypothetical protein
MMIEPPPVRRIAGTQCFTDKKALSRLTAICRRQSSRCISIVGLISMIAAALKSSSLSRPKMESAF